MSDLYIETPKGRIYIIGDNSEEIIIPRGYKIHVYDTLNDNDVANVLPNIPPIEFDMSEEEAEEFRKKIAESIRIRQKMGKVGYGKE